MSRRAQLESITRSRLTAGWGLPVVTDQRSHYRKELDGLRALAILPVILFHAGFIRLATTVMVSKRSLAVSAHDDLAGLGD